MTKELLIKFLNNKCSVEEIEIIIQWINTEALNTEAKNLGLKEWETFQEHDIAVDPEGYSSLLDKIHHKININNNLQSTQNKTVTISKVTLWITRVAAIMLLPVLYFLFNVISENKMEINKYSNQIVDSLEIVAPIGSRTVVLLSDGSKVHLNYGSKLKYPQTFIGNTRGIDLSGEAYFEVAHDPDKPFVVKTGKLNVIALGTVFNVLAYGDNNVVETTLVEGKVQVESILSDGNAKSLGCMLPNQHAKYNTQTGKVSNSEVRVDKYIAWKDGKQVFENEPITNVTKKLNRMFNVEIEVAEEIRDITYTVTFVDEPLTQILDLMALATPVCYKIKPRVKLKDGTFSKQKILIEKRS
jgi:ferric-dicitrate binding protein FerR (iron transport regulator)